MRKWTFQQIAHCRLRVDGNYHVPLMPVVAVSSGAGSVAFHAARLVTNCFPLHVHCRAVIRPTQAVAPPAPSVRGQTTARRVARKYDILSLSVSRTLQSSFIVQPTATRNITVCLRMFLLFAGRETTLSLSESSRREILQ